jgi:hypothetical protein
MWSIAMILYEMMESEHPYIHTDLIGLADDVRNGQVKELKVERSADLIFLYQSLKKIVYYFYYYYH